MSDVMVKVKKHHLARTYDIKDWEDPIDFLTILARKRGRLLAGGEPDVDGIARIVLNDFLRGRIPWFTPPVMVDGEDGGETMQGERRGRLGEMPRKRKAEDMESTADSSATVNALPTSANGKGDIQGQEKDEEGEEEDDFEGFGSDSAPDLDSDVEQDDDSFGDDVISLGVSSEGEETSDAEGASVHGESGDDPEAEAD
jgi:nuclear GTP-binding protein